MTYPPSPAPQGQPHRAPTALWAILVLTAAAAIFVGILGAAILIAFPQRDARNAAAARDVHVTSCGDDETRGGPTATIEILNHSRHQANYLITIDFVSTSGDTKYGTATAIVPHVNPGQTAAATAVSYAAPRGADFTCQITRVSRA